MAMTVKDCRYCGNAPELDVHFEDWHEGARELVLYCSCTESHISKAGTFQGVVEIWNSNNLKDG